MSNLRPPPPPRPASPATALVRATTTLGLRANTDEPAQGSTTPRSVDEFVVVREPSLFQSQPNGGRMRANTERRGVKTGLSIHTAAALLGVGGGTEPSGPAFKPTDEDGANVVMTPSSLPSSRPGSAFECGSLQSHLHTLDDVMLHVSRRAESHQQSPGWTEDGKPTDDASGHPASAADGAGRPAALAAPVDIGGAGNGHAAHMLFSRSLDGDSVGPPTTRAGGSQTPTMLLFNSESLLSSNHELPADARPATSPAYVNMQRRRQTELLFLGQPTSVPSHMTPRHSLPAGMFTPRRPPRPVPLSTSGDIATPIAAVTEGMRQPRSELHPVNKNFGVPLSELLSGNVTVPRVLVYVCELLLRSGSPSTAVFKEDTNRTVYAEARRRFDEGAFFSVPPSCAAALLKSFLRELPTSLIPSDLYDDCMVVVQNHMRHTEKVIFESTAFAMVKEAVEGKQASHPTGMDHGSLSGQVLASVVKKYAFNIHANIPELQELFFFRVPKVNRDALEYVCVFLAKYALATPDPTETMAEFADMFAPFLIRPKFWNRKTSLASRKQQNKIRGRFVVLLLLFVKRKHNILSARERSDIEGTDDQVLGRLIENTLPGVKQDMTRPQYDRLITSAADTVSSLKKHRAATTGVAPVGAARMKGPTGDPPVFVKRDGQSAGRVASELSLDDFPATRAALEWPSMDDLVGGASTVAVGNYTTVTSYTIPPHHALPGPTPRAPASDIGLSPLPGPSTLGGNIQAASSRSGAHPADGRMTPGGIPTPRAERDGSGDRFARESAALQRWLSEAIKPPPPELEPGYQSRIHGVGGPAQRAAFIIYDNNTDQGWEPTTMAPGRGLMPNMMRRRRRRRRAGSSAAASHSWRRTGGGRLDSTHYRAGSVASVGNGPALTPMTITHSEADESPSSAPSLPAAKNTGSAGDEVRGERGSDGEGGGGTVVDGAGVVARDASMVATPPPAGTVAGCDEGATGHDMAMQSATSPEARSVGSPGHYTPSTPLQGASAVSPSPAREDSGESVGSDQESDTCMCFFDCGDEDTMPCPGGCACVRPVICLCAYKEARLPGYPAPPGQPAAPARGGRVEVEVRQCPCCVARCKTCGSLLPEDGGKNVRVVDVPWSDGGAGVWPVLPAVHPTQVCVCEKMAALISKAKVPATPDPPQQYNQAQPHNVPAPGVSAAAGEQSPTGPRGLQDSQQRSPALLPVPTRDPTGPTESSGGARPVDAIKSGMAAKGPGSPLPPHIQAEMRRSITGHLRSRSESQSSVHEGRARGYSVASSAFSEFSEYTECGDTVGGLEGFRMTTGGGGTNYDYAMPFPSTIQHIMRSDSITSRSRNLSATSTAIFYRYDEEVGRLNHTLPWFHKGDSCEECFLKFPPAVVKFGPIAKMLGVKKNCGYCGRLLCKECCRFRSVVPAMVVQEGNMAPQAVCRGCDEHLKLHANSPLVDYFRITDRACREIGNQKILTITILRERVTLHAHCLVLANCPARFHLFSLFPPAFTSFFMPEAMVSIQNLMQIDDGAFHRILSILESILYRHVTSCPVCADSRTHTAQPKPATRAPVPRPAATAKA